MIILTWTGGQVSFSGIGPYVTALKCQNIAVKIYNIVYSRDYTKADMYDFWSANAPKDISRNFSFHENSSNITAVFQYYISIW